MGLMNRDCEILDRKDFKGYFEAQQNISKLVLETEFVIDFNSTVMREFALNLMTSLKINPDIFNPNFLPYIFGILFATGDIRYTSEIRNLLHENIPKLRSIPRCKILRYIGRFVKTRTTFVTAQILNTDYASAMKVEKFVNQYIKDLFEKLSQDEEDYPKHFNVIASNFHAISFSENVTLDDLTYELLLTGLKRSISGIDTLLLNGILGCLKTVSTRIQGNPELIKIVIDIIFDEKILGFLHAENLNGQFLALMSIVKKANNEYFTEAFSKTADSLTNYTENLKTFEAALLCRDYLCNINDASDKARLKLALSSVKKLRKILKTCPEAVLAVPNLSKTLENTISMTRGVYYSITHANNTLVLELIANIAFLGFELSQGTPEASNKMSFILGYVSYPVGRLIEKSKSRSDSLNTLIQDCLPHIDSIIEKLLESHKTTLQEMDPITLSAHLTFIQLHPSREFAYSKTNELCYIFIISMPISRKGYACVPYLDFVDEYSVARAGFFYFLEKYLENPRVEDRPHLFDYFLYLLMKDLVSKTEVISLGRLFKDWRINYF